jgi:hypothetical protein
MCGANASSLPAVKWSGCAGDKIGFPKTGRSFTYMIFLTPDRHITGGFYIENKMSIRNLKEGNPGLLCPRRLFSQQAACRR